MTAPTIVIYNGNNYDKYMNEYEKLYDLINPYAKLYKGLSINEFMITMEDVVKHNALIIIDNYDNVYKYDMNKLVNKLLSLNNENHVNYVLITRQHLTKTFIRNPKIKVIF